MSKSKTLRLRTKRQARIRAAALKAYRALPTEHTAAEFNRAVGGAVRWTR